MPNHEIELSALLAGEIERVRASYNLSEEDFRLLLNDLDMAIRIRIADGQWPDFDDLDNAIHIYNIEQNDD